MFSGSPFRDLSARETQAAKLQALQPHHFTLTLTSDGFKREDRAMTMYATVHEALQSSYHRISERLAILEAHDRTLVVLEEMLQTKQEAVGNINQHLKSLSQAMPGRNIGWSVSPNAFHKDDAAGVQDSASSEIVVHAPTNDLSQDTANQDGPKAAVPDATNKRGDGKTEPEENIEGPSQASQNTT